MKSILTLLIAVFIWMGSSAQSPLFPNSVVSNDIDFILETDPDSFLSLSFLGLDDKEMPSSQSTELFDEDTFVFEATFADGTAIEIWCHSSFVTQAAAQEYAEKLCPRLGKLPNIHRVNLSHIVVHNGNAGAFAEIEGNFFILYSDNMDARISTHDLEETVFHEAVHATIQEQYGDDPAWTGAQDADPTFVTDYAQSLPDLEDMAESALFAYTCIKTPGRLSPEIEAWLQTNIPNRLAFFSMIYVGPNSLTEAQVAPVLAAFPNPTSGEFAITLGAVEAHSVITIYNSSGQSVQSIPARAGEQALDLSGLSPGVYLLAVPGYALTRVLRR